MMWPRRLKGEDGRVSQTGWSTTCRGGPPLLLGPLRLHSQPAEAT